MLERLVAAADVSVGEAVGWMVCNCLWQLTFAVLPAIGPKRDCTVHNKQFVGRWLCLVLLPMSTRPLQRVRPLRRFGGARVCFNSTLSAFIVIYDVCVSLLG